MTPSHESGSMIPKKPGITSAIREKLGFADDGTWRRFSARRLELIDALDLSSRRASDQEENVKNVAHILRNEFRYGIDAAEDFEALVRAAVQSVRRNRKRGQKSGPVAKKPKTEASSGAGETEKSHFLSEIAHLADAEDAVYDMSYSTKRLVTSQDRSRAAIETIIRPYTGTVPLGAGHASSEAHELEVRQASVQRIRHSVLLLIKRSKSCLSVTLSAKNELFRVIGQHAVASVCMLMLERSFGSITKTSFDHIREKVSSDMFQAKFYRDLEPSSGSSDALDDETAAATLHTLVGCCIQDFGYDLVLQHLGDAFYQSILLEYPFVASTSVPFRADERENPEWEGHEADQTESKVQVKNEHSEHPENHHAFSHGLQELAAVASKLGTFAAPHRTSSDPMHHSSKSAIPSKVVHDQNQSPNEDRGEGYDEKISLQNSHPGQTKNQALSKVTLRFLSSVLHFTFPTSTSAPPRFTEILDNGRQAFRLTATQNYGLRVYGSGAAVTDDFDLERLFSSRSAVDLEIHALRGSRRPPGDNSSGESSPFCGGISDSGSEKIILPQPSAMGGRVKFEPLL